jgi:transcriptional regulator
MLQAMYLPPQFKGDREKAAALIQENPFASLISVDDTGLPYVTHLPLHLEDRPSTGSGHPDFVLLGHVAKPNAHWRYLQARPQAVVTFLGPHAYLSPKVYPDLARVPTWNYLAVHCTVQATLIEDPLAKDALLKKLIGDHEPPYAEQWRGLGEEFARKMLAGIVGFELLVTDFQCKVKINQHRRESHAAMKAIYAAGNENEQALANWMDRLGMATGNDTSTET